MKRAVLSVCILALALILTACGPTPSDSAVSTGDSASGDHAFDYGGDVTLRILSGSENQELEGILDDFARERGVNIEMDYQGSLDIMRALQGETHRLRRGVAGQQPVADRGGHPVPGEARRVHLHHPGGVRHPAEPGGGAGLCGAGGLGERPAGGHPGGRAAVLHDQRHPVQLRGQRLHRLPLRPAGQPGSHHIGGPADARSLRTQITAAALRRGPVLRQLRLAEGHVPHRRL